MRITSSGNVGIGTDSPTNYSGFTTLHINGKSGTSGGLIRLTSFDNSSGINMYIAANAMIFNTTAAIPYSFQTQDTERMRITTGGNIIVGNQTNLGSAYQFSFKGVNGGIDAFAALAISNNGNNIINFFNASNSYVASITINASTITYGTGSDYRLKEDLKDFNGLEKVSLIKVYDFKFKEEGDRMEGVLAHELQEIIPYAVTGHKDEIDADGNPKIQNVDYSKIVPVLIKAIQELKAELEELKQLVK